MSKISIEELHSAMKEREQEWDSEGSLGICFKAVELCGEVGELANEIKKLERERLGLKGSRTNISNVKDEFGDVIISLLLLADEVGIDLMDAAKEKFNKTSEKYGFKTKV